MNPRAQTNHFNPLKELPTRNIKYNLKKKSVLLLFVTLVYNILVGNLELKEKKSLLKHRVFLKKLGDLNHSIGEKRKLIEKASNKNLFFIIQNIFEQLQ